METRPPTRVVLVTGSNRGLGYALCAQYLLRPDHTVIAAVRSLSPSSYAQLSSLPRGSGSTLVVSHVDSKDSATPPAAVRRLQAQGITHLDLVIANAGICKCFPTAAEASLDDVREHHEVNVLGPLALFQATLPMLKAADGGKGIFVGISSIGASVGGMDKVMVPSAAYGPSKAALNYILRKAHFENRHVCVFLIEPGWVKTEMGNDAAKLFGQHEAEIEVEESVQGMVSVIDGAQQDQEAYSGRFFSYTGDDYPW